METNEELIKRMRDETQAIKDMFGEDSATTDALDAGADALEAATTEWEYTDSSYRDGPGPKHLTAFSAPLATLEQRNAERVRLGHAPLSIWKRRKAGSWEVCGD